MTSTELPHLPSGSGRHPVLMVALAANDLAASGEFYKKVFGWHTHRLAPELAAAVVPDGPSVTLRSHSPEGFPGMVPFIGAHDIDTVLDDVVRAGGSVERHPWTAPIIGSLARFRDESGTIYGLMDAITPANMPALPMPVGSAPKPPKGTVCHLEMFTVDAPHAARFFGELFGWATRETMPQYLAFDPGAGVGGVFQSHTPSMPAVAYVYVPDVETTLEEVTAAGGAVLGSPMRIPGTACFGYFKDPSGTTMGLLGA